MKEYLKDFPTQGATVFVALLLVSVTGVIVCVRLAMGKNFPDGYDGWLIFLGTLAGVSVGGMIGKRATEFKTPEMIRAEGEAQAKVEAARTSGTFPAIDHGADA